MHFKLDRGSDTVLITVVEPVLNDAHMEDIVKKVTSFLKRRKVQFVVDLHALKYLDSRAVGVFVMCRMKAKKLGGDFILANVPEQVMSLMGIAHLIPVFTIVPTIKEGIRKFKMEKA